VICWLAARGIVAVWVSQSPHTQQVLKAVKGIQLRRPRDHLQA